MNEGALRKREPESRLSIAAVCLLGFLAACGGGGGGSSMPGGGGGPAGTAPAITGQPSDATVTAGQSASFTASATGNPSPAFQWERSSDGTVWNPISGATNATYGFATAKSDNASHFRMKASNASGTATSGGALLSVRWAPEFTGQPANQFVSSPDAASFSVSVDANPAAALQWQSSPDGVAWTNVDGATGATFRTGPTTAGMNGARYRCVATNAAGSATSSPATLSVNVPTFPLTVSLGAGGTGVPAATAAYAAGTVVNYSYSAQPGFGNLQVLLDGGAVPSTGSVTMNAAHGLAVSAAPSTHTVTFTPGSGGTLSGNGNQVVASGASTTAVTAVPNGGFSFLNWTGAGFATTTANPLVVANVTQDLAITANFSALPAFFLSVSVSAGVNGMPNTTGSYLQGTAVAFSYSLQSGFTNLQVTVDGVSVAAAGSVTMNADHTLAATAQPVTPANTVQVGQGGLLFSPSSLTVKAGTPVTFHWASGGHSVVIGSSCTDGGVLNTGVQSAGFQVVYTPMSAGDVPYFCQPHCGSGMTGVLHVTP